MSTHWWTVFGCLLAKQSGELPMAVAESVHGSVPSGRTRDGYGSGLGTNSGELDQIVVGNEWRVIVFKTGWSQYLSGTASLMNEISIALGNGRYKK